MKTSSHKSILEEDDEEENYFVSLSDLMTGVLFIFVILTTALALHYHLKASELTQAVAGTKRARGEADIARQDALKARADAEAALNRATEAERMSVNSKEGADRIKSDALQVREALDALAKVLREREQMRRTVLQSLVEQLRSRGYNVNVDETNGILHLPENLLFRTGEARVQPQGDEALRALARLMRPIVEAGCGDGALKWEAVYVEGHTDNVPIRSAQFASNWELSSARAISTYDAITNEEPSLRTLMNHQKKAVVGISGYADQRPVVSNDSETGRSQNRRIDIRFVMAYPSKTEIDEMERKLKDAAPPSSPKTRR